MQDCIIEKNGKQFVDVVKLLPDRLDRYREVIKEVNENKVTLYTKIRAKGRGKGSKKVTINRFIELDELFFEGLGLWQAEGSKDKGLYFGNTCTELLLRFLEFVESRLGISRNQFKVTLSVPAIIDEEEIKRKWSEKLNIPTENFTNICLKPKTNLEFVQLYVNGVILIELMKKLQEKLKSIILQNQDFAAAYMRGVIAGEGQVELKRWGTMKYISVSSANLEDISFYKECLNLLSIKSGTYDRPSGKFQIYGKRNFDRILLFKLLDLSPNKKLKFETGMLKYKRIISEPKEIEKLILQELITPKTYNDLAKTLKKSRSTIQSFYIPHLENKGLVKRIGKLNRAWLFKCV